MSASGYVVPSTLEEAAEILRTETKARVLAGGQALLLHGKRAGIAGTVLVDLSRVKGLAGITLQSDGSLQIGAMTTLDMLVRDEVLRTQHPSLSAGAGWIGDAQLRNRATVGGSLANADPESDLAAFFLALDASVTSRLGQAERSIPIQDFFKEGGQTALNAQEILTAINLPASPSGVGMAYDRIKHPATLYALCGVAARILRKPSGEVSLVRVAATGALANPSRLQSVEDKLLGKKIEEDSIQEAAVALPDSLTFRSDLFGSSEYRRNLLQVLTRRALTRALSLSV